MVPSPSADQRSTAGLNGIDLRQIDRSPSEAGGQLVAVEVLALGGLNGAQLMAGERTDTAVAAQAASQGAVLLSLLSVGGEAVGRGGLEVLGDLVGRRGRMRVRGVVHGC